MHAIAIATTGDHEPPSVTTDTLGPSGPWDGLCRHVRSDVPPDIDGARPAVAAHHNEPRRRCSALTLAFTRTAAKSERWTRVPSLHALTAVTGA